MENRFQGDGRQLVSPAPEYFNAEPALALTNPLPLARSRARAIIEAFLSSGESTHSGRGSCLWVLVEYCKINNLEYCINGTPAEGYYIELLSSPK